MDGLTHEFSTGKEQKIAERGKRRAKTIKDSHSKHEISKCAPFGEFDHSNFGFVAGSDIRISDLKEFKTWTKGFSVERRTDARRTSQTPKNVVYFFEE